MTMPQLRRMWVNQPSTHQEFHHLHGTNVLAAPEYGVTWQIYFLSGATISQQILGSALSKGWRGEGPVLRRISGGFTTLP